MWVPCCHPMVLRRSSSLTTRAPKARVSEMKTARIAPGGHQGVAPQVYQRLSDQKDHSAHGLVAPTARSCGSPGSAGGQMPRRSCSAALLGFLEPASPFVPHYPALVDGHHPPSHGIHDGVVVGRHHHRGARPVDPVEDSHDPHRGGGVEVAGGFVGQEDQRTVDERPGYGDPLLLSTRELVGI